eukprot:TRINITY_DN64539_c0_g1_i1.p1 TRINITY_DN64539_c0_g1~~TRINITY_DN64539_c0_g1_i1.p1  ORF type:complete len:237 (-),score=34.58 TRINITY_DN64539_c0_g1_i1:132-842(-)
MGKTQKKIGRFGTAAAAKRTAAPRSLKRKPAAVARSGRGKRHGSRGCIFVCAPGAGGGRSQQGLLAEFGRIHKFEFSGQPNLTSAERETPFLEQFVKEAWAATKAANTSSAPLYLVGHSFGSRTALHLLAREEIRKQLPPNCKGLIAFGYPLVHPTQRRETKLMELPASSNILFISGTRDNFAGDFKLLEGTLLKARCGRRCRIVKILGGDHSLNVAKSLKESTAQTIRDAVKQFI